MMRLFAAITPSEQAREHLVSALRPIRERTGQELRWADPDNWHLTLAFYGDQPNDPSELERHLAAVATGYGPLTLGLRGAGSFNQRTLWIGVDGDTDQLKYLMAECLLDPEQRQRQRAHLTVARTGSRTRDRWVLDDLVHALAVYDGPSFTCDRIQLMESHLGEGRSGGPRYETVSEIHLVG